MENVDYDIQYRASKKYPNCLVKYPDYDIPYNERQSLIRMGYIKGATEQKYIDLEKALVWLRYNRILDGWDNETVVAFKRVVAE